MAEVFEAAWFFLPDIPPYAMCDDLRVLSGWALQHIPRQGCGHVRCWSTTTLTCGSSTPTARWRRCRGPGPVQPPEPVGALLADARGYRRLAPTGAQAAPAGPQVTSAHPGEHVDRGRRPLPGVAGAQLGLLSTAGSTERVRSLDQVSVAPDTTVVLQDRFSRALPELAVPWQAEVPAEPELLLNEALAADLGLDPAWLRGPDGLRFLIGNPRAGRRSPGRAGLRGPPVRRLRPAPRRRPRTAARRDRRRRRAVGCATSTSSGFRRTCSPAAATGWLRSGRCCASTRSARPCTRWASHQSRAGGGHHRRTGSATRALPGAVLTRVAAVTCGWAPSSTRAASTTRCGVWPITSSTATIRRGWSPERYLAPLGVSAQAELVAQRMNVGPSTADEHRQHDDLRRETSTTARALHGGLHMGTRCSAHRLLQPLRVCQPARCGWLELARFCRDAASCRGSMFPHRAGDRAGRRRRSAASPTTTRPRAWMGCGPSSASPPDVDDAVVTARLLLNLLHTSHVDHTSFFADPARAACGDALSCPRAVHRFVD